MATEAASVYPALENRPVKNTICLFDVDGTLTPARRVCLSLSWDTRGNCHAYLQS